MLEYRLKVWNSISKLLYGRFKSNSYIPKYKKMHYAQALKKSFNALDVCVILYSEKYFRIYTYYQQCGSYILRFCGWIYIYLQYFVWRIVVLWLPNWYSPMMLSRWYSPVHWNSSVISLWLWRLEESNFNFIFFCIKVLGR